MKELKIGWLFGIGNSNTIDEINLALFRIRRLYDDEIEFIIQNSLVFFGESEKIKNCLTRFPYVFEKEVTKNNPESIGGLDSVALLLNILSSGEVQTPFQWIHHANGQGSSWSTEIYILFYRLINSRFKEIPIEIIVDSLAKIDHLLKDNLSVNNLIKNIDPWLKNRVLVSKNYPLNNNFGNDFGIPYFFTRAVEISSALEYLFQEKHNTEIGFKLSLNVACLLGDSMDKRKQIFDVVKSTYDLRSNNVHGSSIKPKKNKIQFKNVELADYYLRRSILIKATNNRLNDEENKAWIEFFTKARLGADISGIDKFEWLSI